ncbi:MAG: hypothetical protein NC548_60305 [Lachnospiraceae bacterium]|nr:hypothetical protein [Lachnospiraceae bacterium]
MNQISADLKFHLESLSMKILNILRESEYGFLVADVSLTPRSTCRINIEDLSGEHDTQLKMKYFAPWKSFIVQSVLFENRRQGTMTKILDLIKSQANECQIDKIVIESVLSPEMSHCALKNGFKVDESSGGYIDVKSFFEENSEKETIFGGNYVYRVKRWIN